VQLDSINRGLLGLLLLLTLMLLIQRWVLPFDSGSRIAVQSGRYEFRHTRGIHAPILYRFDTTNGAVWTREIDADGPWDRITDEAVSEGTLEPSPLELERKERRARRRAARRAMKPEAANALRQELAELQGIELEEKPQDLSALTTLVSSSGSQPLRGWALSQIAKFPPKDAVPALIPLLGHRDNSVVIAVVRALQAQQDPVAIEPLRKLLEHRNPKVKKAARQAILQLTQIEGADTPE